MCLRVLTERNKSRFDSYSRQEQCIDHIPYYPSGLSRAHFSDTFLEIAVVTTGWILRISTDGDDQSSFWGLKFSIPGFFWLGNIRWYDKQANTIIQFLMFSLFLFYHVFNAF